MSAAAELTARLPDGWEPVDDPATSAGLSDRLRAEVGRGHRLYGETLDAIARRTANDDVVYAAPTGGRIVVVHLTWAQTPEPPPFPIIMYDGDADGFRAWAADDS